MNPTHLTDEQFDHFLAHPDESHPHLAACPVCSRQLTTLRASIADLRQTLVAYAGHPPTLPQPRTRPQTRTWILATASLALAAALIPSLHHPHPKPANETTTQDDEALLNDINHDLSTPIAPSLAPLTVYPQNSKESGF